MAATLMPYAIGRITGAVSEGAWQQGRLLQASLPAWACCSPWQLRCSGTGRHMAMIMVRPLRKKSASMRDLFAWLQQHSARYFGERTLPAAGYRINEGTIRLLKLPGC